MYLLNIKRLLNNSLIIVIFVSSVRHDKGRGVVIIDKTKYKAKCLESLKITKSLKNKIQRKLRKLKTRLSAQ